MLDNGQLKNEDVQALLSRDLFQEDGNSNETLELLKFFKQESTHLTNDQVQGILMLYENDLGEVAQYVMQMKQFTVREKSYIDLIKTLTLADRIKGNAKLSHLMKANANPANTALKPEDVQAKGLSKKEID